MRKGKRSRIWRSEEEMADSFQQELRSMKGLPGIGPFTGVYREVNCLRGRADFIAIRGAKSLVPPGLGDTLGLTDSAVLAFLNQRSHISAESLADMTGFAVRSVRSTLSRLHDIGYIRRTKSGEYTLSRWSIASGYSLWAFELKLNNTRRAVYQAQQYRSFANIVMIVVPPGKVDLFKQFRIAMRRWGIGLASFDSLTRQFKIILAPDKKKSLSKQHRIYAISKLARLARAGKGKQR